MTADVKCVVYSTIWGNLTTKIVLFKIKLITIVRRDFIYIVLLRRKISEKYIYIHHLLGGTFVYI